MKLIIAGTRSLNISDSNIQNLIKMFGITGISQIVSGHSGNVDLAGEELANDWEIPLKIFEADWILYGVAAGPIRNKKMAEHADSLLLIWTGASKGSRNMKEEMRKLEKPIYEVILNQYV